MYWSATLFRTSQKVHRPEFFSELRSTCALCTRQPHSMLNKLLPPSLFRDDTGRSTNSKVSSFSSLNRSDLKRSRLCAKRTRLKYRWIEIVHASNLPPHYAIASIDFTDRHDSMAKDATIRPKVESVRSWTTLHEQGRESREVVEANLRQVNKRGESLWPSTGEKQRGKKNAMRMYIWRMPDASLSSSLELNEPT